MSLSGAVCSVMLYSNLAWSVDNQVTLEFSTPHGVAPNGVLLCATATGHRFDRSSFTVNALEEGGSQFVSGNAQTVTSSAATDLRAFGGATSWNHRAVETGVAADVLGTDAYYASTYMRRRYDTLAVDSTGASLAGVFQDPVWSTTDATRKNDTDFYIAKLSDATLTDTERQTHAATLAELNRPTGNCALLSGSWAKDTRYELKFTAPNPAQSTGATELGWWMAPVTYAKTSSTAPAGAGGMEPSNRVLYTVRGDKNGVVCGARATVKNVLHDACAALALSGANASVAAASVPAACADSLRWTSRAEATNGLGCGASAQAACGACASNAVASYRYSGHCVSCENGAAATVSDGGVNRNSCACAAGRTTLKAGGSACGPKMGPAGTSTSAAALAAELCASFTGVKTGLSGGPSAGKTTGVGGGVAAGAHAIATAHVDAFLAAAGSLVDAADVAAANVTYRSTLMFDERAPDDPTRRRGLAGRCAECGADGTFVDNYGRVGSVKDVQFDAVHALRLIGYVLHLKGYDCDALYNPDDKFVGIYGAYEAAPVCGVATPA